MREYKIETEDYWTVNYTDIQSYNHVILIRCLKHFLIFIEF